MKAMNVLLVASLLGFAVKGQAAQIGHVSSLNCGGWINVETGAGVSGVLKITLQPGSSCREFQVPALNVEGKFNSQFNEYAISDVRALGQQLVLVFNRTEAVVVQLGLTQASNNSSSKSSNSSSSNSNNSSSYNPGSGMSEYERRALALQEQREARERARQSAANAAAAGAVIGEVGGALVDGLGGLER